jgi:hypothetical protein
VEILKIFANTVKKRMNQPDGDFASTSVKNAATKYLIYNGYGACHIVAREVEYEPSTVW